MTDEALCEHEPYRDDTPAERVLRCRRCPAVDIIPADMPWLLRLPPYPLAS